MNRSSQKGFTIIELMIATVVFSLVLLVIMGAIIQFGRIYYKGVIQSRTQERVRAISEDIAKHIQFGKTATTTPSTPPVPLTGSFCAGNQGYTYALRQLRQGNDHGLVTTNSCGAYPKMNIHDLDPGATEMLGERMQLTKLDVRQSGDRYTVSVRVVYGESKEFEGDNPANACKPISFGGQFCAVSELTTIVTKRLK